MTLRTECPGCGSQRLRVGLRLPRQPVVLNYRFASAAEARAVPRRDLVLAQCPACSLVFNAAFEDGVTPYDARYENRQSCSPAFRTHVNGLIRRLLRIPGVRGGRLLEVGCGKGEFLREAAAAAGADADGYDTSYEGPDVTDDRVRFHSRYLAPADVRGRYDAVICRHVVEHVPEIGGFFQVLASIARAAGDPVVCVETPRFEWIVAHRCLWDVFYEHCNYFTQDALAHVARLAGFRVLRQSPVFGDQYQWLELRLARRPRAPLPPGIPTAARLSRFGSAARRQLDSLSHRIRSSRGPRGRWAVWGAGAKGVALVNLLPRLRPDAVVDSNPAKQGGALTGSGVPIIAPDNPLLRKLALVVIANPNYAAEIRADLARAGFTGKTFCL